MKFRSIAALLALSSVMAACVSGSDSTTPSAGPTATFQAQFKPLFGILPFPNDMYFSSTTGQVGIPGDPTVASNGPILQLNHLDGFGTQSDINIYFTAPVDATTLTPANIIVLKVTSAATTDKHVTGFTKALVPGTDYSVGVSAGSDVNGEVVTIKPLHPLDPSTIVGSTPVASTYLVIVTKGVKDMSGDAVSASDDFNTVVTADLPAIPTVDVKKIAMAATDPLFPVAEFALPQLAVAAGAGVTPDKVAVTFSFSTGYLGVALAEVAAAAVIGGPTTQPAGVGIVDTTENVCTVLWHAGKLPNNTTACATVPGSTATEVYAGTVALPYYLSVPSATNPTAALTDFWHNAAGGDIALSSLGAAGFMPKVTVAQNVIPILVAIPLACGAAPAGGWPVTIFQHGITRNREDMLAAASTLSVGGALGGLCTAVLAIDLPLHGVTDTKDPFYVKGHERTFDMDLQNNITGVAGPDGTIDSSGAWFINLSSTVTSRDNLREGAADLLNLVATLPNIHPGGSINLDSTKVFFVGHSLGGIVGTTFLGADTEGAIITSTPPKVTAAVLAMPGGHVAELLRNSSAFGPVIDAGLAAQGLQKGTQEYYDFYSQAQAVVEDGDPANYAALAAGNAIVGHLIHVIEVVGGHNGSPSDLVVPNSATDVLIGQMGITATITATSALALGTPPTLAQFTSGGHSSILSPAAPSGASSADVAAYAAVTAEMQAEMASVVFDTLAGLPSVKVTSNTFLSATLKK